MRSVFWIGLNDLRIQLKDRAGIFFLLIMPLGFIFFFASAFGSSDGGPESVTVVLPVVREDEGWLSDVLLEKLKGESFDVKAYSAAAADTVEFGTRVARIPAGFTDDVLAAEPVAVGLTKAASSNVTYDLAAEVKLSQAILSFLGDLASWDAARGPGATAGFISEEDKGRLIAAALEPAKVKVAVSHAGSGRPVPTGMSQSVPGVMAMFVVMSVLIGGSEALTREKKDGTLRRLATTPLGKWQILAGKVLGLTFLGMVQAGLLIGASELLGRTGLLPGGFSWDGNFLGLALLLIPYSFAAGCIALFLSGLFRTTKQAESVAWLVGMVFAGLGGTWWPLEIVPTWLRQLGHAFPTAWAMDGLHGLVTFGGGLPAIVVPSLVLIGYGLVFALLGTRTMKVTA